MSVYALPFCALALAIALTTNLIVAANTAGQVIRLQQLERQAEIARISAALSDR